MQIFLFFGWGELEPSRFRIGPFISWHYIHTPFFSAPCITARLVNLANRASCHEGRLGYYCFPLLESEALIPEDALVPSSGALEIAGGFVLSHWHHSLQHSLTAENKRVTADLNFWASLINLPILFTDNSLIETLIWTD